MEKETFKKSLIDLLRKSKIYYINVYGEIEEYKILEDIEKKLNVINDKINILKHYNAWDNAFSTNNNMTKIDNNNLINENMKQIGELLEEKKSNILDVREEYSLDRIAHELSKIGETEDFYYYYKYSKLKELKEIREQGTEKTLKFIRENAKK